MGLSILQGLENHHGPIFEILTIILCIIFLKKKKIEYWKTVGNCIQFIGSVIEVFDSSFAPNLPNERPSSSSNGVWGLFNIGSYFSLHRAYSPIQ